MKKIKFYHITLSLLVIVIGYIIFDYYQYRSKIDNSLSITLNTTEYTNKEVIVTINGDQTKIKAYSFDNGKTWQESNKHSFYENGNIECYVKFQNDRISKRIIYNITNIDKDGPIITFEDNLKVLVNSSFDPLNNVVVTDEQSGVAENISLMVEPENINTSVLGLQSLTYTAQDKLGNISTQTRNIIVVEEIIDDNGNIIAPITQYRYRTKIKEEYDCSYSCDKKETANTTYSFKNDSPCCHRNGQNNCTIDPVINTEIVDDKCIQLTNQITLDKCDEGYLKYNEKCYAILDRKIATCPSGYTLKNNTCEKTVTSTCPKTCTRDTWSEWSPWSNKVVTANENTEVETRNIGE